MSFAAPLLLIGLGALAVPVVLHLMAREVPKTIHFPTLRFITRDKLETNARRGLRDLLLLLMRCLVLAGLVLAFAKPFLEKQQQAAVGADNETVVLLDISASMNRKGVLKSVKEKLQEDIQPGEMVALFVSGSGIVSKFPFADKEAFLHQLDSVKFSRQEGRHEVALHEAVSTYTEKSVNRKLILVSDFRQNDWNFTQVPQVEKEIKVKFINPFDTNPDNVSVYVDRVRRLNAGEIVQVQVLLNNQSAAEKKLKVTFTAGKKEVQEEVELKGQEKRRLVMTMTNPPGSQAVVSIPEDDYPFDDTFHVWIGEDAPINILFPEQGEGGSLDFTFVQKALEDVKTSDASFKVFPDDAELFAAEGLEENQVLILADSAWKIPAKQYEGIRKFVEEGGLLFVAPQDKAGVISSRLKAFGLADITFSKTVARKSRMDLPFTFSYRKENTPLLRMFEETPDSDLQNFPIYKYNLYKIGGAAENILGISEEIPGLAVNPLGKGNVIISSIPFNHVWSDFTLSNSFLPLLRQTIISLVGDNENALLKLNVGDKKGKPGQMVVMDSDYIDTSQPGCQVINQVPIVVNVSRLESNQNTVNVIDLKNRLRSANSSRVTVVNEQKINNEYWQYFILLALVALFLEFIFADLARKPQKSS